MRTVEEHIVADRHDVHPLVDINDDRLDAVRDALSQRAEVACLKNAATHCVMPSPAPLYMSVSCGLVRPGNKKLVETLCADFELLFIKRCLRIRRNC
jgi:hypothetical protein